MKKLLITLLVMCIAFIATAQQEKGDIVRVIAVKDSKLQDPLTFKIVKGNTYQAFTFGMPVKGKQPPDSTGVLRVSNPKAFNKKKTYNLTVKIENARTKELYRKLQFTVIAK